VTAGATPAKSRLFQATGLSRHEAFTVVDSSAFAGVDRITIRGGSGNDRFDGTVKDDHLYGGYQRGWHR
jgi:hypothetical protein